MLQDGQLGKVDPEHRDGFQTMAAQVEEHGNQVMPWLTASIYGWQMSVVPEKGDLNYIKVWRGRRGFLASGAIPGIESLGPDKQGTHYIRR